MSRDWPASRTPRAVACKTRQKVRCDSIQGPQAIAIRRCPVQPKPALDQCDSCESGKPHGPDQICPSQGSSGSQGTPKQIMFPVGHADATAQSGPLNKSNRSRGAASAGRFSRARHTQTGRLAPNGTWFRFWRAVGVSPMALTLVFRVLRFENYRCYFCFRTS